MGCKGFTFCMTFISFTRGLAYTLVQSFSEFTRTSVPMAPTHGFESFSSTPSFFDANLQQAGHAGQRGSRSDDAYVVLAVPEASDPKSMRRAVPLAQLHGGHHGSLATQLRPMYVQRESALHDLMFRLLRQ